MMRYILAVAVVLGGCATVERPAPVTDSVPAPVPQSVPAPVPDPGTAPIPDSGTAPMPESLPGPVAALPAPVPANAAIASLERAPKGARGVLEQQLADAAAGRTSVDLRANEAALRLLCVRGEVAAGLETPDEDTELRREHQMRRLVETMGRGGNSTSGEMEDLVFEWLAVGPVDAAVHATLLGRFQRCFDTG